MTDDKLKESFRTLFPEYETKLNACEAQEDFEKAHAEIVAECRANLKAALDDMPSDLAGSKEFKDKMTNDFLGDADRTVPIVLTNESYENMKNATGEEIKAQIQVLMDGLARLKDMNNGDDPGLVTAKLVVSGALAIGGIMTNAVVAQLLGGAVATAAAFAGVTIATVGVVIAIATLVIVAVVIPILYFILKSAVCFVFLINELDAPLTFAGDSAIHGKRNLMTTPIPQGITIPGVGTYPVGGMYGCQKNSGALVGTNYGVVFKYKNEHFAFGVENPLTSIYKDNNCYCEFGSNANLAAQRSSDQNNIYSKAVRGDLRLSIRCNSKSGSVAYFIARAYRE